MNWKTAAVAAAVIAAAQSGAGALAQAPPAAAAVDPARLALAHQVFEAIGGADTLRANMQAAMAAVSRQMPVGSSAMQKAASDAGAYAQSQVVAAVPQIIRSAEQAYAENFSVDELKGILAFYQSPTGQALKAKQPAVTAAMMAALAPTLRRLQRRVIVHTLGELCAKNACSTEQRATLAKLQAEPD